MSIKSKAIRCSGLLKIFLLKLKGNHLIVHRSVMLNHCCVSAKSGSIILNRNIYVMPNTALEATDSGEIDIDNSVFINRNCVISAKKHIFIGEGTTIGPGTLIYDHDHDVKNRGHFISQEVNIGKNVWIGGGCIVLKGVTIGDNSVIAAGTIVTSDIPQNKVRYNKIVPVDMDLQK